MSIPFEKIHPDTTLGLVALVVPSLPRALKFYRDVIGLQVHTQDGENVWMGALGGRSILQLAENAKLPGPGSLSRRTTGLFHFAILVPSRRELARTLQHLNESGWPVQGAADHLVSEAVYLSDPDGNGIEIYRDLPRSAWPTHNGQLQMATDPLDIAGVMAELDDNIAPWTGMHPDTVLGHIHLRVSEIAAAEAFYSRLLGFDLMLRYGTSASFVSAGGYHHHVAFNTWGSAGAPPPPPNANGLRYFTIYLANQAELERLVARLRQAGLPLSVQAGGFLGHDPSGNGILFTA